MFPPEIWVMIVDFIRDDYTAQSLSTVDSNLNQIVKWYEKQATSRSGVLPNGLWHGYTIPNHGRWYGTKYKWGVKYSKVDLYDRRGRYGPVYETCKIHDIHCTLKVSYYRNSSLYVSYFSHSRLLYELEVCGLDVSEKAMDILPTGLIEDMIKDPRMSVIKTGWVPDNILRVINRVIGLLREIMENGTVEGIKELLDTRILECTHTSCDAADYIIFPNEHIPLEVFDWDY